MIELVVFDMAGTTLYDGDAVADCFCAALAAVDVKPERAAVNAVMGLHKPEAIRRLLTDAGRSLENVDAIHVDFVARMVRYYAEDPNVREIPGATATFAELRRAGIKVALNTGFSGPIVDVILRRLEWLGKIDDCIASDEAPRGRPYPDMIQLVMKHLKITDASRVAKVGDTPVDLQEGTNAGCGIVVGVTTGAFTRAQLEVHPHTHIIESIRDLPALLR
jgi:phosphonatase-like hydrolase